MNDCKTSTATCAANETKNTTLGIRHKSERYTIFDSGTACDWARYSTELPGLGKVPGKFFLKDLVGLTASEISINAMPPGAGMPFHHSHKENEEVYIFISGKGEMQIDGATFQIVPGSIVRVTPAADRTWRNTGAEPLVYIVSQMRDGSLRQYGVTDGKVSERPVVWA